MESQFPVVRHVVMDEAHNYEEPNPKESWYAKGKEIVRQHNAKKPGYLWIFMDERQLDHCFRTGMPHEHTQQPEVRLKAVIRNSGKIFKHSLKCLKQQESRIMDNLFLGHDFQGESVSTCGYTSGKQSQSDVVNKTVKDLLHQGYRHRDLAVLFSKRNAIPDDLSFGPFCPIVSAKGNSSDDLVVSTVEKYSGLDRPVVILVDIECSVPYGRILPAFQYSAQTRAMVKLVIIRCEDCRQRVKEQKNISGWLTL